MSAAREPAALTLLDDVRWQGSPVPGERAHSLLAALALEPSRGVGDGRLVDEVWADEPPANPVKALQVLVSRTRAQTAPEVVQRTGQGYRLGLTAEDVDATRLAGLVVDARAALAAGDLRDGDVLVVADEELAERATTLPAGVRTIVIGTTVPLWAAVAEVVLPITNMAEEEGTFTNLRGRVQRYTQAKAGPGLARPAWYVLGDLLAAMGQGQGYFTAADAFAAMAAAELYVAGMSYETLGLKGALLEGATAGSTAGATTEAAR